MSDLNLLEMTVRRGEGADEAFVLSVRSSAVGQSAASIGGPNVLYAQAADAMARCVVRSALDSESSLAEPGFQFGPEAGSHFRRRRGNFGFRRGA